MGESIAALANGICRSMGDCIDIAAEGAGQRIIEEMQSAGFMKVSPVHTYMHSYFLALLNWHSEEFANTKSYTEENVSSFIKFLFEQRTLCAAFLINLKQVQNLNPYTEE